MNQKTLHGIMEIIRIVFCLQSCTPLSAATDVQMKSPLVYAHCVCVNSQERVCAGRAVFRTGAGLREAAGRQVRAGAPPPRARARCVVHHAC